MSMVYRPNLIDLQAEIDDFDAMLTIMDDAKVMIYRWSKSDDLWMIENDWFMDDRKMIDLWMIEKWWFIDAMLIDNRVKIDAYRCKNDHL